MRREATSARPAPFRPEIEIGDTSTKVLVVQSAAVDESRLGGLVRHTIPEEL
ncbi:MAG: hypothetical protein ACRDZO_07445 [Egibacteraceae bacterium]